MPHDDEDDGDGDNDDENEENRENDGKNVCLFFFHEILKSKNIVININFNAFITPNYNNTTMTVVAKFHGIYLIHMYLLKNPVRIQLLFDFMSYCELGLYNEQFGKLM